MSTTMLNRPTQTDAADINRRHACIGMCWKCPHAKRAEGQSAVPPASRCSKPARKWPVITLGIY